MTELSRRRFLGGLATAGTGLAGCLESGFTGQADRTLYVGSYHWGFILLDGDGNEYSEVVLRRGERVRLVAFNTTATEAVASLPEEVRAALPDHEALEERNEERIPSPPGGMHEALEEANARYPNHSAAVMPSGYNHPRQMHGGMMLHPVPLQSTATRPATAGLVASRRGDYTVTCLTYCGYGHPYMEVDGAFVVR